VNEDDPHTGRRFLTGSAYADDRNLRSRQAIFAYAERKVEPGWRLSSVDWDGSQVVADIGCGNGVDLRQLIPQRRCRAAIGIDLSAGMLRSLTDLTDTGRLVLVQGDAQQLPLADASVDVALAMHMLYHVPDIGAAARELRRIVRPGGTVLASTNSSKSLAEINDLVKQVLSARVTRPARGPERGKFSAENGAEVLEREFAQVTVHRGEATLAFPTAQPVLDYVDSIREPILAQLGQPIDFDAVLDEVRARVDAVIAIDGRFLATYHAGVFTCR
jgi:ubiquinone/menaquinone biosynthesis C-methylase UbiE